MDINYSRMWIVHNLVTIKDESCKTNANKCYTIMGWDTKSSIKILKATFDIWKD
jgi:hypothetical protein